MNRRPYLLPAAVLVLLLALSLGNSTLTAHRVEDIRRCTDQALALAAEGRWPDARKALAESRSLWEARHTYFHVTTDHDALDQLDCLYCRAEAAALDRDWPSLRAELCTLAEQLCLLGEEERCSLRNTF